MIFDARNIKAIYAGELAQKYDFSMPPFFSRWKRKAIDDSTLKSGDRVLVFCCGSGLDFPHILSKIGNAGKIVGVDFSVQMLRNAQQKIDTQGWVNIELIEADITTFKDTTEKKYDVGICTLGMSIIPDFKSAYNNLISEIKPQGEIIIGDMQLASGWLARLNPLTIFLAEKFGGTHKGHQNSLELCSIMKQDLSAIRKKEFFFKSYYYCIGKTQ
ncbi:methyltransferase domain-containing protein [bacterium]|nr:methyltransferase domain-containing protein [bacterium]